MKGVKLDYLHAPLCALWVDVQNHSPRDFRQPVVFETARTFRLAALRLLDNGSHEANATKMVVSGPTERGPWTLVFEFIKGYTKG